MKKYSLVTKISIMVTISNNNNGIELDAIKAATSATIDY
jgi:hypothetical protein